MSAHLLDLDGDPWDGTWGCRRCMRHFDFFVDASKVACDASWPGRVARFRRLVSVRRSASSLGGLPSGVAGR